MNNLIEKLKDKWITWRTGKNAQTRAWDKWLSETIVYRGRTAQEYFRNFRYIIEVNPDRFFNPHEPLAWAAVDDFVQYLYPQRELGDNALFHWFRGFPQTDNDFYISDLGSMDRVYVATNNAEDAIMITLKFG